MLINTRATPETIRAFTEGDCAFFAAELAERLNTLCPRTLSDDGTGRLPFAVEFLCVSTPEDSDPDWFHAVVVDRERVHDTRHQRYTDRSVTLCDIRGIFLTHDDQDMDDVNMSYTDDETVLYSYQELIDYYTDMPGHPYTDELPDPSALCDVNRIFPDTDIDTAVDDWITTLAHRFEETPVPT